MAFVSYSLTISQPRNIEAWQRCEEISWGKADVTDYCGERSPQFGIPMADRIASADSRARAVFRFIAAHPGCSPVNVPTCNVRIADVIDRLEGLGLIQRKYRITTRDCGPYKREYRVVALYAVTQEDSNGA